MADGFFNGLVNLEQFFLNDIASGDELALMGFLFVLITFFCAKFRFSNQATLIMLALVGLLMGVISERVLIVTLFTLGSVFTILLYKSIIKQE